MTLSLTQTEPSERPSSVRAIYVDPRIITESGWLRVAELLQPAVSRQNDYRMEQLLERVAMSQAQLWAIAPCEGAEPVGMLVSEIVSYPSGLTGCEIIAAATKDTEVSWESMRSVVATIEEFAQAQGADILRILGRRGWQRVFRDFDLDYVCLTKKIREYSS